MDNSEELGHWRLAPGLETLKNPENLQTGKVNFCNCSSRFDWTDQGCTGYVGFVYLVRGVPAGSNGAIDDNGWTGTWYIGRKLFSRAANMKPLKGRVNKRKRRLPSDWMEYETSSPSMKRAITYYGKDRFEFYICGLARSIWELNYMETAAIIQTGALYNQASHNGYLRVRLGKPPNGIDPANLEATLLRINKLLPTAN